MADQQMDLAIVVEAINKASATLKQVEKDLGGLSKSAASSGAAAATASGSFGTLVAGVATGTVVANIAMGAFQKLLGVLTALPGAISDIAKSASEVEGIGVAMHIVANNAGITAEAVDKVRNSVVEQNVTTQAANRLLTDLIRNQLDYTQATQLAAAAQNIAVASGVSSSETIERISDSIASGNTWLLRELGLVEHLDNVYERYGETLGKASDEMTEAERKQAVVNYVLSEGEKYAGAYDAAMTNASKVMRSTNDRIKEISYSFGRVLEPALYEVSKAVYDAVNSIVKWAHEHEAKLKGVAKVVGEFMRGVVASIRSFVASIPWDTVLSVLSYVIQQVMIFGANLKVVFNIVQLFARGIQSAIVSVVDFGRAMFYLSTAQWGKLKDVINEYLDVESGIGDAIMGDLGDIGQAFQNSYNAQSFDLKEWWKNVEEIEGTGWEDRLKQAEEGGDKLTQAQRDKLKKMLHDIEKENRDYSQAVAKRAKDFSESFDDLVLSHRDKIKELTADLTSENKDYKANLQKLLEDYNEAMTDIETRHKDKTESIKADMEDERKKALEEIEKITEAYNEETGLISREGEDRVSTLQAQLDKERALGSEANQAKITSLEQMIAYEKAGLASSLDDKKAKYDEEVADVNETLNDKLEKIKKELADEDTAYADSYAKRKTEYANDVEEAKAAYEEKRSALQTSLDAELAIQTKFADDFKRLADAIAEDDLTRLVRKNRDEIAEMEREHQERLADIKYQAFEGGEEYTASFSAGFDAGYPQVKSRLNQMSADLNTAMGQVDKFNSKVQNAGKVGDFYTPSNYPGGNYPYYGQAGGLFSKPTIVGEAGAEVVLPLSFPKRMAQILQTMGIGGGGNGKVEQNFYITVSNPQDIDVLMERAGFAMRQGGGYKA